MLAEYQRAKPSPGQGSQRPRRAIQCLNMHEHTETDRSGGNTGVPEAVAAQIAALSARVAALERDLATLHNSPSTAPQLPTTFAQTAAAPPPPPMFPAPTLTPSATPPQPATPPPLPRPSLENRLGSQIFNRIGVLALLIGVTWFLKLAIDNQWIGPVGRVLIGLLAGAGVILWSERFRRSGFSAFSYSLKAIGTGVLYLSIWASFQLYHLLPAPAALAAMLLVTAWIAFMAWTQNAELLAVYALAGAFATPALLSTGGNHEIFLFTYLLAADLAAVFLARLRNWPRLLLGAFPATVGYFVAWYLSFFNASELGTTVFFVAAIFAAFLVPSLTPAKHRPSEDESAPLAHSPRTGPNWSTIPEILLPFANAAFAALAMYSLLTDIQHRDLLPWLMVLFAALYLGLLRLPSAPATRAVHLSLAVVFLTIAIPLKATGHWITVGWIVEGAALFWAALRIGTPADPAHTAPTVPSGPPLESRLLRSLALASLALGFCGVVWQLSQDAHRLDPAFLNARFGTALLGILAFALTASLASQASHKSVASHTSDPGLLHIAAASVIALNLLAIFAGIREIPLLWSANRGLFTNGSESGLQQALAISAFLMLYGAGLLAVGFWRKSAFLRWQGLVLLAISIAKTFLYDVRDLSAGYRVMSFLGLGALLMAVSFAYQKDWLDLREPLPGAPDPSPPLAPPESTFAAPQPDDPRRGPA